VRGVCLEWIIIRVCSTAFFLLSTPSTTHYVKYHDTDKILPI
jgi:hypothetical protein